MRSQSADDTLAACRRNPDAVRQLKELAEVKDLDGAAAAFAAVIEEVTDGE